MHLHKSLACTVLAITLFTLQTRAQDAQDEAIKKAILNETNAYYQRDSTTWLASWIQDATISRTYVATFGFFTATGWQKIGQEALKDFRDRPKPDSIELSTDSFTIRKEGKMAVVDYKQTVKYTGAQPPFDLATSREHRVMIKKDGKWKIASQITTDLTGFGENGTELSLNAVGYSYLFAGKTEEAIKVLELNTILFPKSFNVFDSLGEAYAKAGNKELAIQNYEKSLVLNPKNETGRTSLEKLKK